MTAPDPNPTGGGRRRRVTADVGSVTDLSARLANAEARIGTVRSELVELLADIDSALGVGDPARAFRRGFCPVGVEVTDALHAAGDRLGDQRRALVAGVRALADADADAAARLDRRDT
ncbi:hypothetical protein IA539_08445 [Gordonia sp. zg691]|uniref:Uncharacterized protein n=1 Tax=Gordonia jinghuaiqii TaxID=2758710 RepID=A0A7D7RT06_9ACTN|nr:hypothetical protein [Gordonia jinghuaiqii]MBD0861241.1 hypothetical protein [Gordonia jinghuaiqii]MCR5980430.1 hypothetical protein [Gordonia jinghuaiqii]QMT03393.1 hypothetical protein H1R19_10045 [Gordonia jinghuaiqii]